MQWEILIVIRNGQGRRGGGRESLDDRGRYDTGSATHNMEHWFRTAGGGLEGHFQQKLQPRQIWWTRGIIFTQNVEGSLFRGWRSCDAGERISSDQDIKTRFELAAAK